MSSVAAATKLSKSEPSVHRYLNHHSSSSLSVTLVCILHSWLTYACDGPKFTRNIKNEWYLDPALLQRQKRGFCIRAVARQRDAGTDISQQVQ